jgi:predicted nuclease of predicted toxin-antitoxin system
VRILTDERWNPEIVRQLRRCGYDAVAVSERREFRTMSDALVFAAAQAEGRAIVTEDVRDDRLLATQTIVAGGAHHGLILTNNRRPPRHHPGTLGRVVEALAVLLEQDVDLTNREIWLTTEQ